MGRNRLLATLAAAIALWIAPGVANAAGTEVGKTGASPQVASSSEIDRGRYMVLTGHCYNCRTAGYARKQGNVPEKQWLLGNPVGYRVPAGTT